MRVIRPQYGVSIINADKMAGVWLHQKEDAPTGEGPTPYSYDIRASSGQLNTDHCWILAKYSTRERALEALERLSEWLTNNEYYTAHATYKCFQMPQDDEGLDT